MKISQVQNMINNYNARIQDLSPSIRSSKMAINNILNNRDLYNYGVKSTLRLTTFV